MATSFRLFVGGMTGGVTPQDLQSSFGQFGKVTEVQDVSHKGFSYVQMEDSDEARIKRLIFSLNSTKFRGKVLKLAIAKPDYLKVLAERQEKDKKDEAEKLERKLAKLERRSKIKLLPPAKPSSIPADVYTDPFVPSIPYGWTKVRGMYVPIIRLAKKGREGGILVDPKAHAHGMQNILSYVKDIKCDRILTEMRPRTQELDQEHKEARRAEVDRWAHGLIRQRKATDNPIDESWQELLSSSSSKRTKISTKTSSRMESFDDDFEVVSDSDDDGSQSFTDSDTPLSPRPSSKSKAAKDSIKSKKTSAKSKGSDKSAMLSVIDSILKGKTESDYGDSDSQDFEMNPTSGESSDEEEAKEHHEANGVSDDEQGDDISDDDDDSISAASFDADRESEMSTEGPEKGVVNFDSDDDVGPTNNVMDVDSGEESSEIDQSYSGDHDEESDGDSEEEESMEENSDEEVDESADEAQDSGSQEDKSSSDAPSEDSDMDESDDSESSGPPKVEIPSSFKDEEEEDDLQLHIIATPTSKKQQPQKEEEEESEEESGSEGENNKKRPRVWSADSAPANKKFAYHELVREADEKIFSLMRDAPNSQDKGGFKFLPNRKSEPSAAPVLPLTFAPAPTAPVAASRSAMVTKETEAKSVKKADKGKMFLFGAKKSSKEAPSSSSMETASPLRENASRSFVRQSQVDQVQKMWSGTKDMHKQMAQKRHKVATKRVSNSKRKQQ